jgi:hypothetical protein
MRAAMHVTLHFWAAEPHGPYGRASAAHGGTACACESGFAMQLRARARLSYLL